MGSSKKGRGAEKSGGLEKGRGATSKPTRMPKKKCCQDRPRCARCPIRMLKEGTLPAGYGVHRRKLVRLTTRP